MIRVVHTLGGCGGTLLSRCLGVLPGATLLSEVNPAAVKLYAHCDPLYQDNRWLHLLSPEERAQYAQLDLRIPENFCRLIARFYSHAAKLGRNLILRDFNYIDFIGVPFDPDPPQRLTLYEALPDHIPTQSIAFIRHPIDQWVSLCKHEELRPALKPRVFSRAYLAFLEKVRDAHIYKYEDFVANPENELRSICRDLALPFAPSFAERFHSFDAVTGDYTRLRETSISAPEKKQPSSEVLEEFLREESYREALALTEYAVQPA